MFSESELESLLVDLESDRVERKASPSDRDKIRQAICAFANDLPDHRAAGVVFVGAHDDGSCSGLPITDELLRTLADMRSDGNILPFPVMSVQKRHLADCEMAVIEVQPADSTPVRFNRRLWIRVGPRRAQATIDEERRLIEKRRWGNLSFDRQPVPGTSLVDLDLDLFKNTYLPAAVAPDVLAENQRTTTEQLAALHFLGVDGRPNVGGILVFGKDPLQWLPGAYVQFLRLDGPDLTSPINDQKELSGPLPQVLRQLDETLEINISVAGNVAGGPVEIRTPDYPIVALQQLARNAVLHRNYESTNAPVRVYWYSDRIEIYNPGGLYGHVTPSNFGQPGVTDYRNPLLAEALKTLGYVQRFGLGIPLARQELSKNRNLQPQFQFEPTGVLVTIWRRT